MSKYMYMCKSDIENVSMLAFLSLEKIVKIRFNIDLIHVIVNTDVKGVPDHYK